MESKTSIVFRSFLRISIIPIIVFSISAWLTLKLVEPGYVQGGCLTMLEDPKENLLMSTFHLMFYLCFTPFVLLNFIRTISKSPFLRILALTIPVIPVLTSLYFNSINFLNHTGRVYLYMTITTLIVTTLILRNTQMAYRKMKS